MLQIENAVDVLQTGGLHRAFVNLVVDLAVDLIAALVLLQLIVAAERNPVQIPFQVDLVDPNVHRSISFPIPIRWHN